MADADLLILGGGCAGLSLGSRLAERPGSGRTLILEQRQTYGADRTWCFWRLRPHRFDHLVAASWSTMAVTSAQRSVAFGCSRTPYQMIPSSPFYAEAQELVRRSPHVRLATGVEVRRPPRLVHGLWRVETSKGAVSARQVVDTRPPDATRTSDALLWQSFLGEEVECEAPVFDPATAGLMHFAAGRADGVQFCYVLPFSPTRALVETTVFGPQRLHPIDLSGAQAQAVARLTRGAPHRLLRSEHGVLPMGMTAAGPPPAPGFARAGLMSGAARPSTGYAFQRIQRWAETCADAVGAGRPVMGHAPDPALRRVMDRLFLRVLRARPERGPELFTRMFGVADPARVIRFLSDAGTVADCVALGARLPLGLFLGELARSLVQAPRDALRDAAELARRPNAA